MHLSGAIKFVSARSPLGNLNLFEITRASVLFSRKFQMQFNVLRKWEFFWFLSPSHFWIRNFFLHEKYSNLGSEMWKVKLHKILGNLLHKLQKIVHEWPIHVQFMDILEIFRRPQVIENFRSYLLLRKDILQKTVVGCPCFFPYHWL